VTSVEVIQEIERLPKEERQKVFDYARYAEKEQLSPEELEAVLRRLVESTDPSEKERLKAQFTRGFYGNEPHA
jgi:hypothetical protein